MSSCPVKCRGLFNNIDQLAVAGIRPLDQEQEELATPKNMEQNTSNAEVSLGQEEVDIILNVTDEDLLDFEPDEAVLDSTIEKVKMFKIPLLNFRSGFRMTRRTEVWGLTTPIAWNMKGLMDMEMIMRCDMKSINYLFQSLFLLLLLYYLFLVGRPIGSLNIDFSFFKCESRINCVPIKISKLN